MKIGKYEIAVRKLQESKQPQQAAKPQTNGNQSQQPSSSRGRILAPFTEQNSRLIMERVPIANVAKGRLTQADLLKAEGNGSIDPRARVLLTEADLAVAQTTVVLGQYAPQFGWPDDWALYWEYLDARLLVPEVSFAVAIKRRMIWKNGFEIATEDKGTKEEFMQNWRRLRLEKAFKALTEWALIEGNGYAETVDDSKATWASPPAAGALGADQGKWRADLKSWQPATELYGLKIVDPRTMRVYIHPDMWDKNRAEPLVERYIQRKWTGPLGPNTQSWAQSEILLHPDQVVHLKFNRIVGGIYGYSMIREVFYTLKAYLLMLQYLPAIVQKRADIRLQVKYGGAVKTDDGKEVTVLMPQEGLDAWVARTSAIAPGEDLYTDILTTIEQVYKNEGVIRGLNELIQVWKERVLIGVNTPTALLDPQGVNVSEIKWGGLKFEMLENEILEYQHEIEDVINGQLMLRLCKGPAEFHFNPIMPEDWRASVTPLLQLYQNQGISREYMLQRLNMPSEAAEGTLYPLKAAGSAEPISKVSLTPAGVQKRDEPALGETASEKWRVRHTVDGDEVERVS